MHWKVRFNTFSHALGDVIQDVLRGLVVVIQNVFTCIRRCDSRCFTWLGSRDSNFFDVHQEV